ncbi:hypothetical protein [Pseudomonas sp. NPDC089406]|uniref:hypothetical protein n=1 Tax=Pseudomonas sp. NPDC089406 TaxID=3364463 RepID=UPI00384E2606
MRLIPCRDVARYPYYLFETPFFALSHVERALVNPFWLPGLIDLIRDCGFYTNQCLEPMPKKIILSRVEKEDWLLACADPFVPFKPANYDFWSGAWYRGYESSNESVGRQVERVALKVEPAVSATSGPGKWKITSIRVNRLASSAAFVANFLVSRGEEGRAFLSSKKDYANTTRTVTQAWVPLGKNELNFAPSSANHKYGQERIVTQIFVEADDAWDVSGSSWHWRPVIKNEEYEFNDK